MLLEESYTSLCAKDSQRYGTTQPSVSTSDRLRCGSELLQDDCGHQDSRFQPLNKKKLRKAAEINNRTNRRKTKPSPASASSIWLSKVGSLQLPVLGRRLVRSVAVLDAVKAIQKKQHTAAEQNAPESSIINKDHYRCISNKSAFKPYKPTAQRCNNYQLSAAINSHCMMQQLAAGRCHIWSSENVKRRETDSEIRDATTSLPLLNPWG
jgi:hypothetical protein